jgi:maltose alpha-D-glucosyltransferase/alpha-amylase
VLVLFDGWNSFFPERVAIWRRGLATRLREQLEKSVAPKYIVSQRWYAGKGAPIVSARFGDNGEWETQHGRWLAGVFEVESKAGKALYFLPFAIAYEDTDESRWQKLQAGAIARVRRQATVGVLADATADENFCRSVVEGIGTGAEIKTERGMVRLSATQM